MMSVNITCWFVWFRVKWVPYVWFNTSLTYVIRTTWSKTKMPGMENSGDIFWEALEETLDNYELIYSENCSIFLFERTLLRLDMILRVCRLFCTDNRLSTGNASYLDILAANLSSCIQKVTRDMLALSQSATTRERNLSTFCSPMYMESGRFTIID